MCRYRAILTPLVPKTQVKGFLLVLLGVWGASSIVSLPMGVYSRMIRSSE